MGDDGKVRIYLNGELVVVEDPDFGSPDVFGLEVVIEYEGVETTIKISVF
jgi:hypothetical protein